MKRLASAFIAIGLIAAAPAAAQAPQVSAVDWAQRVETTPEGGYRMGNPDAPLKLVEFLSLTCSHCATFSAEATPALVQQVRSGRVSVEYRNYVLNHYDLAAAVLSRCAAPSNYFALTSDLLAQQAAWAGRADALTPAQKSEIEVRPTPQSVARTAELIGLKQIAGAHGIAPAEANRCLASAEGLSQVMAMRDAADRLGVTGTPTFMLNGRMIGAANWTMIQPLLAAPGTGAGERGR
ncbi:MAG: protein-disulfide isomerase [Alphaproteobacteria bacterium]|jgi:protein-disulfide isomerase|nr:protein-disulfide isomerase [Alphaproteobacteria bacterium]